MFSAPNGHGGGWPDGFDLRLRPAGFGPRLVSLPADQLRARLAAESRQGARFCLALPAAS